jgi:hypothetical protein
MPHPDIMSVITPVPGGPAGISFVVFCSLCGYFDPTVDPDSLGFVEGSDSLGFAWKPGSRNRYPTSTTQTRAMSKADRSQFGDNLSGQANFANQIPAPRQDGVAVTSAAD